MSGAERVAMGGESTMICITVRLMSGITTTPTLNSQSHPSRKTDESGVDESGVDESGVDESGVDESGI